MSRVVKNVSIEKFVESGGKERMNEEKINEIIEKILSHR